MGQHHEIHLGDEGSMANALRIVMRNYFSTQLLAGAVRMTELARRIEDDHTGESRFDLEHRGYVLSSVLSAVGFLEAMVNELFQDAHDDHAPDGGAITPLDANTRLLMAEYWRATEQGGKGRALDKYQALLRFAGEPALSQGAQPFQDASLAVQLRNAIAHYRPQDLSADTPSLMEQRLSGKFPDNRLMAGAGNPWWPDKCLGWGCADWVIRAVTSLADHVVDATGVRPNYMVHRATGWLGNVPGAPAG
jgi:hypothetical protein